MHVGHFQRRDDVAFFRAGMAFSEFGMARFMVSRYFAFAIYLN